MGSKELSSLINQLGEDDGWIIRQVCAIIYRYLKKRGRLDLNKNALTSAPTLEGQSIAGATQNSII